MTVATNFSDVLGQLQAIGLMVVAGDIEIGKKKRCRVRDMGPEKRGWFHLHEVSTYDGQEIVMVGAYGYSVGAEHFVHKVTLHRDQSAKFSQEQLAAWRDMHAKARAAADAESKRAAEAAGIAARKRWEAAENAVSSPYLAKKGVDAHGIRIDPADQTLLVPVMDVTSRFCGLQLIYSDPDIIQEKKRDKDFWPTGAVTSNHFYLLGGIPRKILLIAEGFATAATLHQATGIPVAVAFFSGNLLPVAQQLSKAYRNARILICADDDYRPTKAGTPNHAGEIAARTAAAAVGGSLLLPIFAAERPTDRKGPTDFNDLHLLEGLHVVRSQVEAHLSALGWLQIQESRAEQETKGERGAKRRPNAASILDLDTLVDRFIPIDDGGGESLFDTWTRRIVHKKQMIALLPAGVRADDIKRHPEWITRGAYYVDEIGFDPAGTDENIKLNTWQGWPMKPKQGNCQRLIDLIDYLCSNDDTPCALSHWLQCWMAYPLQHPGAKMSTAVIMHGPQGTGKSTIFQALVEIYGDYATVLNQRGLEDKFNADWTDSKLFLLAEEVVNRQEMWHIKGELKELVTGQWVRVRDLHRTAYRQKNHINLVFLSNEDQPLPIDNDDRRHLVIYTPPEQPERYYDLIQEELMNGGVAAFYFHLMHLDITGFHPKKRPPMTVAKTHLLRLSLPSERRFTEDWLNGELDLPVVPCLSTELYSAYLRWCRTNGESRPRTSAQFYSSIHHSPGWDKRSTRIYASPTSTETVPKPVVSPPMAAIVNQGTVRPTDASNVRWITDCCARFSAALHKEGGEK
ncbi:MAG: toprim domain-containing protein [Candidatus Accumulibacter sp.]|nr:toprim domain-containing protein [Accumulibacter sp.]